jgi:phenylalanyl-tRNA synthetase beta chain
MYISFNWLKTLVDFQANHSELAEALTRVGLAVEGISAFDEDWILDIDLTSNRPDCLSHLGIAREIAVIYGSSLKQPVETESINVDEVPFPAILAPDIVKIEDSDLCHRFTGRIVRGVEIGPSPEWLVRRLESIGERSINNVADITNYVCFRFGSAIRTEDSSTPCKKR